MSKMMGFLGAALLALGAGCGTSSVTPTNCVAAELDGGTANDVVCNLGWSCNSNTEHYEILCTAATGGNEACTCTSDQTVLSSAITINSFVCQGMTALPVVNACGHWQLEM
jgi:hypothetical protein